MTKATTSTLAAFLLAVLTAVASHAAPEISQAPVVLPYDAYGLVDGMLYGVDWQAVSDSAYPGQDVAIPMEVVFGSLVTADARSHAFDPVMAQQLIGGTGYALFYSYRQAPMAALVEGYLASINVAVDLSYYAHPQEAHDAFVVCVLVGEACICLDAICSQYYDEPVYRAFLPAVP